MIYKICRFISFVIVSLLFEIKVSGKENIPKTGAFILASNHISNLDPVILGVVCPKCLNYIAKKELFRGRFWAFFFDRLNCIPVKRDCMDIFALKEAMKRVAGGKALLFFPQGRRGVVKAETKAQPGIGFLVSKSDAPVVPAFITGTDQAMPKGTRFPKPVEISVVFGRQIYIERRETPYQEISDIIMDEIRRLSVKS